VKTSWPSKIGINRRYLFVKNGEAEDQETKYYFICPNGENLVIFWSSIE